MVIVQNNSFTLSQLHSVRMSEPYLAFNLLVIVISVLTNSIQKVNCDLGDVSTFVSEFYSC